MENNELMEKLVKWKELMDLLNYGDSDQCTNCGEQIITCGCPDELASEILAEGGWEIIANYLKPSKPRRVTMKHENGSVVDNVLENSSNWFRLRLMGYEESSGTNISTELYRVYFYFDLPPGKRPHLGMKASDIIDVAVPVGSKKQDIIDKAYKSIYGSELPEVYYADTMRLA